MPKRAKGLNRVFEKALPVSLIREDEKRSLFTGGGSSRSLHYTDGGEKGSTDCRGAENEYNFEVNNTVFFLYSNRIMYLQSFRIIFFEL